MARKIEPFALPALFSRTLSCDLRYNALPRPRQSSFKLTNALCHHPPGRFRQLSLSFPLDARVVSRSIPPDRSLSVQFDVEIDGSPAGRIVFHLFDAVCPITARNFRELATGENGYGYSQSYFHRIVPHVRVLPRPSTNCAAV